MKFPLPLFAPEGAVGAGTPAAGTAPVSTGSPGSPSGPLNVPSDGGSPNSPKGDDKITAQPKREEKALSEPEKAARQRDELMKIWDKNNPSSRPRGPDGKFASRDGAKETAPAAPADPNAAPAADGVPLAAAEAIEAPKPLTAEEREVFSRLPPDAQKALKAYAERREGDYAKHLAAVEPEVKAAREFKPVMEALNPHREYLVETGKTVGMSPAGLLNQLVGFERTLRHGSAEQKLAVLVDITRNYGIPIERLLADFEEQPDTFRQNPEIETLRAEIRDLKARNIQADRGAEQQRIAEHVRQVEEFKSKPGHEHFEDVRDLMARIVHTLPDDQPVDLEAVYTSAIWADPKTRAKLLAAESAKKAAEEAERNRADEAGRIDVLNTRGTALTNGAGGWRDAMMGIARRNGLR